MMTLMGALSTIPTEVAFQPNLSYFALLMLLYYFIFNRQPWAILDKCVSYTILFSHHNDCNSEVKPKPRAFLSQIPPLDYIEFYLQTLLHESLIHQGYSGDQYSIYQSVHFYKDLQSGTIIVAHCFLHLYSVHADLITAPPSRPLTSM